MSKGTRIRTVRIPDDVWEQAQARAEHEGRTLSELMQTVIRRYARGEAYAFLGDAAGVRAEIEAIPPRIGAAGPNGEIGAPDQMLAIARAVLTGRLAMMEERYRDAAAAFAEGAQVEETEDFQRFRDPPAFWYPVRRDLARALWAAGDREGALGEAEKTLAVRPLDPGALALIREIGESDAELATGTTAATD